MTDYQQSILWRCLNNKPYNDVEFQNQLNAIIEEYSTDNQLTLWRGLSTNEAYHIEKFESGDIFTFGGVKSFSEIPDIAQMFCDDWHYATHTLVKITNPCSTFKLYPLLTKMILDAPDCELKSTGDSRDELLDIVADEREHMLPNGTKFMILNRDILEIPVCFGRSYKRFDLIELECLQYPE